VATEPSSAIALIPAAGRATRLGVPATSKEILPVGTAHRPVAHHLLAGLARAGIDRALVLIRADKWDIPERLGDGAGTGVRIAYLAVAETGSICETLDRAYPFVGDRPVVLGFPDILFRPGDAFARIVTRQRASGADAVLALVPTDRPHKADLVRTDPAGRVLDIAIKPPAEAVPAGRPFTWIGAVWTPAITGLLHELVEAKHPGSGGRELYPSDVLLVAIERGLRVEGLELPAGRHLDVGTPDDLERARFWEDGND